MTTISINTIQVFPNSKQRNWQIFEWWMWLFTCWMLDNSRVLIFFTYEPQHHGSVKIMTRDNYYFDEKTCIPYSQGVIDKTIKALRRKKHWDNFLPLETS